VSIVPPDFVLNPADLPSWSEKETSVDAVLKALDNLRQTELRAATRTSVATLIIVNRTTDELDEAETVIDHLGERHPARIITLLAPEGAGEREDRIDADITLHSGVAEGHEIWSDEIRMRVSGGPARHLASLLRPLLLSDLPVIVWYINGIPDEGDPLLKVANAVVVDSKSAIDPGEGEMSMHRAFGHIAALTRRNFVVDLSWERLRPWRKLLAAQFDGAVYRPFIQGVHRLEITGKLGPRTLLAGWLGSRLNIDREHMHLYDGRHVSIRLFANVNGHEGEFCVERVAGEYLIRASAEIENGPHHEEIVGLPSGALPLSLSAALRRLERDRTYEQSIKLVGRWL
jgi:glucose-6-phosphate dehydrogenase assembly protein OpcA